MAEKKKIAKEKESEIYKKLKKYALILIWLGVLVVVFVVIYSIFQGVGKIEYKGLTFIKEKYGEVIIYHYSYTTELSDGTLRRVEVLLRGNPIENNISVEGKIIYPAGKTVFLSINGTGMKNCEYDVIGLGTFSLFMANNGFVLKAGPSDKEEAQTKNQTYITCEKYPNNMVLSLKAGNESKIEQVSQLCYNLEVAECDILPIMEKFIVQSILDAKESS